MYGFVITSIECIEGPTILQVLGRGLASSLELGLSTLAFIH